MKLPRKYCYEYLDDTRIKYLDNTHIKYLNDTHIEDLDSIYITKLLIRSIDNGESRYLSYCVNVLIRKQLVGEVFKILCNIIQLGGLPLYRKDSGYESDFEIGEVTQQYEYPDQYAIDEAISIIIKTLINAGINMGTYKYETVETPLHWATTKNNIKLINLFIKVGVDVDIKNNRGATALHLAVINNDFSTVKAIINAKAQVNIKDNEGNTPLHLAVYCENYNIVAFLLKAGANPNIFCPLGDDLYIKAPELQDIKCTSLQLASFIGNVDIIKLLIKHGADPKLVSKNKSYSCAHMAVLGITCYYNEGISEEKEEEYLNVVGSLVSQFPDQINSKDHEYNSPLHRAVSAKHEDIIRVLIENGALLSQFRTGGYTALHDAVAGGNLKVVKLLLESSDKLVNSVYRKDHSSQLSPLHLAINAYIECLASEDSALNIIKYLLSYPSLDINIKDLNGETPLHYAIKYIKNDELALTLINELLIVENINPFIKDSTKKTPFDYALEKNKIQILQKLIHHKYYNGNSLLHLAAENDDVQAVEYFVANKIFDINLENRSGYSPLHLAAERGYVKIVEILLNKGAIIDDWEECGYTALQKAGINGHLDVVKLLLTKGANVNTSNLYGATIIHLVISQYIELFKNRNNNDLEQSNILNVIRYLLDYDKLDINAQIQPLEFSESPFFADKKMKTVLHHLISSDVPAEHQDKKMGLIRVVLTNQKVDPFIKDAENKTPIDYYIEQKKYSSRVLDQYAKIQEDRSTRIESYNTKKYIMSAIALCMINSTLGGLYINQYPLEIISDIQSLGLALIANVVVCICCYIISKYVEKSIEEKYKNKVLDLFENNNKVPFTLEGNLMLEGCYNGKTI